MSKGSRMASAMRNATGQTSNKVQFRSQGFLLQNQEVIGTDAILVCSRMQAGVQNRAKPR
jgi:hypothetical protein